MERVERKKKAAGEQNNSRLELLVPFGIEEAYERLMEMDRRNKFLRLHLQDYLCVDTWPLTEDECEFQIHVMRVGRRGPTPVTLTGKLCLIEENYTLLTAESEPNAVAILKELVVVLIVLAAFFGIIAQSLDMIPIIMFFLIFVGIFSWVAARNTRDRLFREIAYQLSRTT